MIKKLMTILLSAAFIFAFAACGADRNVSNDKYSELESFLDKGQYDAAITLIQQMKDSANQPAAPQNQDAEKAALLDALAGFYTTPYQEKYSAITINKDMTITLDDKTYPIIYLDKDHLQYSYTEGDVSYTNSLSFKIFDNGIVDLSYSYQQPDQLRSLMGEDYQKLVGQYHTVNERSEIRELTLHADYTMEIDGTLTPVFLRYEDYSSNDGRVHLLYTPEGNPNSIRTLEYSISDLGMITLAGHLVRDDQFDFIDLTEDNLNDYFEWTDWKVYPDNVYKNAFGELENVYSCRYLRLKDEFQPYYFDPLSSVALEIEYTPEYYNAATFTYNADTNVFTFSYESDPIPPFPAESSCQETFARLSERTYRDEETGDRISDGFYLLTVDANIAFNQDRDCTREGNTYIREPVFFVDEYCTNDFSILRSATKLAFLKKGLN